MHYHSLPRDKISAIGALSVSPKRKHLALYLQFHRRNLNGLDVKAFLGELLKHLRGEIILLWDRSPIHSKRKEVSEFLRQQQRIQVEEFPTYAPELNPAEYIWNQTDRALSNTAPQDLEEVHALLSNSVAKISNSQKLLWSCIYASDLPWR